MKRSRINRRAAAIAILYAVAVTAYMSISALYGYAPLVFYTSVIWFVLPLMVIAWVRNRKRRKEEDKLW